MKKNTTKILMAALALFMAIGIATGTTFAWFALNSKVGVTGMEVTTKVSNSILIAPSSTAATAKEADSAFKTNYLAHSTPTVLLEPVSTVNGTSFFYNNSKNVAASGDAIADSYIAYNPASTTDFNTNYNTTGAVGYVDYAFQLKVTNTDTTNPYKVNLTQCDLIYAGAATTQKAFRVAVFVSDMGADGSTSASDPGTLLTILRPTSAAYFSGDKAVSNATAAPTAVDEKIDDKAIIGTVGVGATRFYKVVVRLWLEGEDTTCNNTTFATLTSSWALNLAVTLESSDTNAVAVINNTNSADTANLSAATVDTTTTKVIDGVTYYAIETVTLGSATLYTTGTTVTPSSLIYTISGDNIITDVTNQCTLPTTP